MKKCRRGRGAGPRERRRHTNATMYLARWNNTGRQWQGQERTSEGEAESVAKWTAGTGDAQGTQAECQIELVQSRGIITNEFKTEASAGEIVGVEQRRRCRPSPRHQALDWWTRRSPREQRKSTLGAPGKSGRMNNTEVPVLWDEWQGGRQDARSSLD